MKKMIWPVLGLLIWASPALAGEDKKTCSRRRRKPAPIAGFIPIRIPANRVGSLSRNESTIMKSRAATTKTRGGIKEAEGRDRF